MTDVARALDRAERKRLGQYFTGEPLARLLAGLARAERATSVIDPMAGSGDMLAAARLVGFHGQLTAVDIDPVAAGASRERLCAIDPGAEVRVADAFDPRTWMCDTRRTWDLVITNPPYVRYQQSSRSAVGRLRLPTSTEVRHGLLEIATGREALPPEERSVFCKLIDGYSGLSDLAVPSWLLCALLVAQGGQLAMLVPDTWLSRDYALPILYLLRRYFEIEFVVADGEASWFEDALIRTTLVVARRCAGRSSALGLQTRWHVHARLSPAAASSRSLVGRLYPWSTFPERRFSDELRAVVASATKLHRPGLTAEVTDDGQARDRLLGQVLRTSWGKSLEATKRIAATTSADIPRLLREIGGQTHGRFCTLEELGWHVGQGLRTGANRFFYGELVAADDKTSAIVVDAELSTEPLIVPNTVLRVVVRRQQDLVAADGDAKASRGRLICLTNHALEEDLVAGEATGVHVPYEPIPEPLARYVRRASRLTLGTTPEPCFVPCLSAVVTNVRPLDPARPDRPPRFWYQLPPLVERHTGVVFLARVNHRHPEPIMNASGVVIDANFSTLWPEKAAPRSVASPSALRALLASNWAIAAMEASGTILGAGALKIEATHLRRLALPVVSPVIANELSRLGDLLGQRQADRADVRAKIDELVWEALGLSSEQASEAEALSAQLLEARGGR